MTEPLPGLDDPRYEEMYDLVPGLRDFVASIVAGEHVDIEQMQHVISNLDPGMFAQLEQVFTSLHDDVTTGVNDAVSDAVSDDHIVDVATRFDDPSTGQVVIGTEELCVLEAARSAAEGLARDADNPAALRSLLAVGWADRLTRMDGVALHRDADDTVRQLEVVRIASELARLLHDVTLQLHMTITRLGGPVATDLGALNDATNELVTELLTWFPDVVDHFDALIADRVAAAIDEL